MSIEGLHALAELALAMSWSGDSLACTLGLLLLGAKNMQKQYAIPWEGPGGLGELKLNDIDAANSFLMLLMARSGLK